jgi:hypothetical protein
METALKEFLLDYLDDVEQRRWEYEATLKAAEERKANDKPVNTRNLHEAKRNIAFYDHLRDLINDDTSLDEQWKHRYQDILSTLLREHDEATRMIKESMFNADDVFDNRPSGVDKDTWEALTG